MTNAHPADVRVLRDPSAHRLNRGYLIVVAIAVLVVALVAAVGFWWVNTSTVSNDEFRQARAEAVAANAEIATLEVEVASLTESLSTAEAANVELVEAESASAAQIDDLQSAGILMEGELDELERLGLLFAADAVNYWAEDARWLADNGADVFLADDLLAEMGKTYDFVGWSVGSQSWHFANSVVDDINDAELSAYWIRFSDADDLDVAYVAAAEFRWRLAQLMLGMDGQIGPEPAVDS